MWKELRYGSMSEREKQQLVAEVNILREFQHPHIVRYFDRVLGTPAAAAAARRRPRTNAKSIAPSCAFSHDVAAVCA